MRRSAVLSRSVVITRSLAVAGALALSVGLSGCGSDSADLAGKTYTSTEVRGHDLVPGSTITLAFEEGRISANAGCNTMNGSAQWSDGTLEVDEALASTMMACDEALMAQDQWLADYLKSGPALKADGDTLTLGDDTTGITLSAQ